MKSFKVRKLNGHQSVNLEFHNDLTILYGLNGSGKTTILRLLSAIANGSISEILQVSFETARLTCASKASGTVFLDVTKDEELIQFEAKTQSGAYHWSESLPKRYNAAVLDDLIESFESSPVAMFLREAKILVFLGIDRCQATITQSDRQINAHMSRFLSKQSRFQPYRENDEGLENALALLEEECISASRAESRINRSFRDKILVESLKTTHLERPEKVLEQIDAASWNQLKRQRDLVMSMIDGLDSRENRGHLKSNIEALYDEYRELAERIDRLDSQESTSEISEQQARLALELLFNASKLEFLGNITRIASDYTKKRTGAFGRLNSFIESVNRFFSLTGKEVTLSGAMPVVKHNGSEFPIYMLSSGERQIIILFAHLALNRSLRKGAVFVLDEPELSLHIAWQEMLLDTIAKLNPSLQVIVATHSPSIIEGHTAACQRVGVR